ncbi:MAG: lipoxygenase family protein, partial [Myxococcota bacterium]
RIFPLVREPAALNRWKSDAWFARERVAGTNPILLARASRVPENVPLKAEEYARAMPGDTLDAALAEGRLFVLDHGMLEGISAGVTDGFRKYLDAPISIFALPRDRTRLLPVCIQCRQVPDGPLFFPWHGTAWLMARTCVQVADSCYHGVVQHGTHCHMMMGVLSVLMHRTLAPTHPLSVLLRPNLEMSLFVDSLTEKLFEPGGRTPTIQSFDEWGTLKLARWAYGTFDWTADGVPERFVRRGVMDDVLPFYPARDDLIAHERVLRRFVRAYVRLYYGSDGDVEGDPELQAFIRALGDDAQGGMRGIGEDGAVVTPAALETFLVQAIQRASSYHAVINYSVFDAMGFAPNMPMAQFGPSPRSTEHAYEDFLAMLPPASERDRQFDDVFVVASLRANRLGHYRFEHFLDRRVRPLVREFQAELAELEFAIEQRNDALDCGYEVLLPSKVTASIHI